MIPTFSSMAGEDVKEGQQSHCVKVKLCGLWGCHGLVVVVTEAKPEIIEIFFSATQFWFML